MGHGALREEALQEEAAQLAGRHPGGLHPQRTLRGAGEQRPALGAQGDRAHGSQGLRGCAHGRAGGALSRGGVGGGQGLEQGFS